MRNLRVIIPLLALFLFGGASMTAQDTSAQRARKARLEREIAEIDKQLSDTKAQSRSAESQLVLVRKKIVNRRELVKRCDREIQLYSSQIISKQTRIKELLVKEDTLAAAYSKLVSVAYRHRDPKLWYMYILSSDNLGQAFRRYVYFRKINENLSSQARQIRQLRDSLEVQKAALSELVAQSRQLKDQRQLELTSLRGEEKHASNLVDGLRKDSARYQREIDAKKRQISALNREIQRMVTAAMKGKDVAPVDYALSDEFSKNMGKLPWPAEGMVVEPFGENNHPVFTNVKLPFNNGITMSVKPSSQIKAVFNGVVKQIVVMPGYNQCILVQHGEFFSFYCKMASCNVKAGDKVKTGQVLGTIDTINGETQLHFQIWQNQTPQNPEEWLRP